MTPRTSPLAVLMVLGSCLSLQLGAALALRLFPVAGTWGTTALRLTIAAVLMVAILRPRVRGWDRRAWGAVVVFGLSLAGTNGLFYAAVERLPLSTAVAIEFLGPLVLAAVLSRRLRDLVWIGLAFLGMAALGVGSLAGEGPLDLVGVLLALGAAVFWALYILAGAHAARTVPGSGALPVAMVVAAVAVLPVGGAGALAAFADPGLLVLALCAAVLASVIPYSLEFAAMRRLPRHVFGVLLSLEPAAAALAGFVLAGQAVGLSQWIAITLVVAASAGITLAGSRATAEAGGADEGGDAAEATDTGAVPIAPGATPVEAADAAGRGRRRRRFGRATVR